jgi:ubiquinone/menaquinone biosynthesis C-methylase UbiE
MQEERGAKFEQQFVTNVYDNIAPHFSHTRYKAWPFVEQFLKNLPKYTTVADVGCGNGKYLNVNKDLVMVGSDMYVTSNIFSHTKLFVVNIYLSC